MPDPTAALLLVLALAAGLAASIVVAQHLRPVDTGFYRHYLTQLLLFNLLILSGLVFNVLRPGQPLGPGLVPVTLMLMGALKLGWLLAFSAASRSLFDRKPARRLPRRFTRPALAVLAAYAVLVGWGWFSNRPSLLNAAVISLELLVLGGAVLASVLSLSRSRKLPAGGRRASAVRFGVFHAAFFGVILAALCVSWLRPGPESFSQLTISALLLLLFNVFPPLWIRRHRPGSGSPPGDRLESLGITRRESEIIQLIQAGRTNQEIADELFISLATVKDHNNNLFRKCGVRNRVELANLFR